MHSIGTDRGRYAHRNRSTLSLLLTRDIICDLYFDWQAWPLLPAYGAIAGNIIGLWSSLAVNAVYFLAAADKTAESEKLHNDATASTKKKASGTKGRSGQKK